MPVSPIAQPNFTSQDATTYKTAIDDSTNVSSNIGHAFAPTQKSTPGMLITVNPGVITIDGQPEYKAAQDTTTIVAPVSNSRIDRVFLDPSDGNVGVATGVESASPSAPTIPSFGIPIARIFLYVGQTSILNDDITDERALFSDSTSNNSAVAREIGGTAYQNLLGFPCNPTLEYLAFDSINQIAPTGMTFSRSSAATRINALGIIETMPVNAMRHEYDPATGEYLGWLIEEQSTNELLQSEDFNTTWVGSGQTVTTNTHTAPDGTATADTITWTSAGDTRRQNITIPNDASSHTNSIFIHRDSTQYVAFQLFMSGGANLDGYNILDTTDGSIVNIGISADISVKAFGDNWWRITVGFANNSSGNVSKRISFAPNSNNTGISQTTGTVIAWGAQTENQDHASSYIPATTAQVTRTADSLTQSTSAFPYNSAEGTLYIEYTYLGSDDSFPYIVGVNDGAAGDEIVIFHNKSTDKSHVYVAVGGVAQFGGVDVSAAGSAHKVALAYKLDNFAATADGLTPITDNSGSIPNVNNIDFGARTGGGASGDCLIRHIIYYPRAAPAFIQNLTK